MQGSILGHPRAAHYKRYPDVLFVGCPLSGAEPVLASSLKRALLRKDPTFSESDYGFRAFRELLAQAERNGIIALHEGQAPGDPAVDFPDAGQADKAFDLLRQTLLDLQGDDDEVPLSGLKDQLRKRDANWSDWYAEYMAAEQSGGELPT